MRDEPDQSADEQDPADQFEKSDEYRRWRRFEKASGDEKEWMNQRLTWVFTAQAFLFAAFGLLSQFLHQNLAQQVAGPGTGQGAGQGGGQGLSQAGQVMQQSLPSFSQAAQQIGAATTAAIVKDAAVAVQAVKWLALAISLLGLVGTLAAARMHWLWTSRLNRIVEGSATPWLYTFGSRPHFPARTSSIVPPMTAAIFCIAWLALLLDDHAWFRPLNAPQLVAIATGLVALFTLGFFACCAKTLWPKRLRRPRP